MSDTKSPVFECTPENAPRFWKWIHKRGGLAKWKSVDLSDPGKSWTTPVLDKDGQPSAKQHWKMANAPSETCTNPDEVMVVTEKEVKRYRVGIRVGSQGMSLKVTDAGSRRIRATLAKMNEERDDEMATYHFDYETQEAVFTVPDKMITLTEWAKQNPELAADILADPLG
jgi:hypothetical protein